MEKSNVKGVRKANGKWIVRLKFREKMTGNVVTKQFGSFDGKEEAEELCLKLRKELYPNERTPYNNYGEMGNSFRVVGDCVEVDVRYKDVELKMLLDNAGFEKLKSYGRNVYAVKFKSNNYYAFIRYKGVQLAVHRIITDCPEGLVVDHINHQTLDNREENLRNVTISVNLNNRTNRTNKGHSTGLIGITRLKDGKYQLSVKENGKWKYVGKYKTRINAMSGKIRYLRNRNLT